MPRIGRVGDQNNQDPDVIGARKFFELATSNSRLVTTAVQTVGSKGCDGFRLAGIGIAGVWKHSTPRPRIVGAKLLR